MSVTLLFILKIMTVTVILAAMIFILLGIHKFVSHESRREDEETRALAKELEKSDKVISRHSLFHKFLADK